MHKKINISITGFLLFSITFLSAEVIGNLEFKPPVSLKAWNMMESNKNEESSLKMYMQSYEHDIGNFIESLMLMNFHSEELSVFSKGYSEERDIKKYLENKHQKIIEETCADKKSYSNPRVSVANIIVDPNSLFYQVTMLDGQKPFGYTWHREIKKKGQWVRFAYGIMEKHPGDPDFSSEDIEKVANPWIKFLKDDFFEKVVFLK